jgi:GGDEF domain-containing protein
LMTVAVQWVEPRSVRIEQLILPPSHEPDQQRWATQLARNLEDGLEVDISGCLVGVNTKAGVKTTFCPPGCLTTVGQFSAFAVTYDEESLRAASNASPEHRAAVVVYKHGDEGQQLHAPHQIVLDDKPARLIVPLIKIVEHVLPDFKNQSPARPYRSARTSKDTVLNAMRNVLDDVLYGDLRAEGCEAWVFDYVKATASDSDSLVPARWTQGAPQDLGKKTLSLQGAGEGLSGWAFNRNAVAISNDTTTDWRVKYAVEEHSQAAVAIPLSVGRYGFGVLYAHSESQPISKGLLNLLLLVSAVFAEYLGRSILSDESERTIQDVSSQQFQNWLDRLHGQRDEYIPALRGALSESRARRADGQLVVLVFDIDRSSRLSDHRFGGDLRIVSALNDSAKLVEDLIAKSEAVGVVQPAGRDQFVAIFPNARNLDNIKMLANNALEKRRGKPVIEGSERAWVTMSCGMVYAPAAKLRDLDEGVAIQSITLAIDSVRKQIEDASDTVKPATGKEASSLYTELAVLGDHSDRARDIGAQPYRLYPDYSSGDEMSQSIGFASTPVEPLGK